MVIKFDKYAKDLFANIIESKDDMTGRTIEDDNQANKIIKLYEWLAAQEYRVALAAKDRKIKSKHYKLSSYYQKRYKEVETVRDNMTSNMTSK